MRLRARRERRPADERGTVVLMAALMLAVLMTSAAFAVDLGMLRVSRSDMQAIADVVALDAVRELDGRDVATLTPVVQEAADASLARNPHAIGRDVQVDVQLGDVRVDGTFGVATEGSPTAVRVVARATVDYAFAATVGTASGSTSRSAVANAIQSACYSVGSYASSVNTGNSALLDPVLDKLAEQSGAFGNGQAVAQAIGYQGLLQSSVRLGDVALALSAGSVTELASATVTVRAWFTALKAAYGTTGNATTIAMLNTLAAQASLTKSVALGQVLSLDTGSGSLADLRMNLLDLVMGSLRRSTAPTSSASTCRRPSRAWRTATRRSLSSRDRTPTAGDRARSSRPETAARPSSSAYG